MIPTPILNYFINMKPGEVLKFWAAKNPVVLIHAAREYIDQGGNIEFSEDYEFIKKLNQWPED